MYTTDSRGILNDLKRSVPFGGRKKAANASDQVPVTEKPP
jgi:hypothetical protein